MTNSINNEIATGVFVKNLTNDKFKTMRISLNFILPLSEKTVSDYALIPSLITQTTKDCPSIDILAKHLASLYGASLDSSVASLGDNQVLSISSSGIADRFALDGENLSEIFSELICGAVFNPLLEEGEFLEHNFRQEKRQLLETLEADINDKMIYVKTRLREIMYKDEACFVGKYGNLETISVTERIGLYQKLLFIIENAPVEILVMGNCDFETVKKVFASYFNKHRTPLTLPKHINAEVLEVKKVTEEMSLSQSKVVMGFRTCDKKDNLDATRLMCMLLGGSASSKFFLNIREKHSLCYYCGSTFDSKKSTMIVHSGVETENIEVIQKAILKELEDVKNGEFTEQDIEFAKLAMCNSYNSVNDSLSYTETWYITQVLEDSLTSPEEMVSQICAITKNEIIEAAKALELDTIFVLKGVSSVE